MSEHSVTPLSYGMMGRFKAVSYYTTSDMFTRWRHRCRSACAR